MNPFRVLAAEEWERQLVAAGYIKTETTTETGTFWKAPNGRHVLVPHPYDGMYPEFILTDLRRIMKEIERA